MAFVFEYLDFNITAAGPLSFPLNNFSAGDPAKAVIIWNTEASSQDRYSAFGFGVSASSQACVTSSERNGLASSECGNRHWMNNAILGRTSRTGAYLNQTSLTGFGASGTDLVLSVDDFWLAESHRALILGGSDLDAAVVHWDSPTALGDLAVTGVGFQGTGGLTICGNRIVTPGSDSGANQNVLNFALWDNQGNQEVIAYRSRNGQNPSATATDGAALAYALYDHTGTHLGDANLKSWDADGFTLEFIGPTTPVQRSHSSLILGGVDIEILKQASPAAPGPVAYTLGIEPTVGIVFNPMSNGGINDPHALLSVGDSGNNTEYIMSENGVSPTVVNAGAFNDRAVHVATSDNQLLIENASITGFSGNDANFSWLSASSASTFRGFFIGAATTPTVQLQGTIDIDGHSDGDGSAPSTLLVLGHVRRSRPSYRTGYARSAAESAHPELWNGLAGGWCPSLGPTGLQLLDQSGRGYHGTLVLMPPNISWVQSEGGWALYFGGVNDFVDTNQVEPFNPRFSDFSLCCWFKSTDSGVEFMSAGSTAGNWYTIGFDGTPNLRAFFDDGTNTAKPDLGTGYNDGQWHHFYAERRGSIFTAVVDGAAYDTVNNPSVGEINVPQQLRFGSRGGSVTYYQGFLDDLRFYHRPLTMAEVRKLSSRRAIAFEPRSLATVISVGPPPPISLQGTIDIDGHSDGDGSAPSTLLVLDHVRRSRPSYRIGYARNASESAHPGLWDGLEAAWCQSLGATGIIRDVFNRRHGNFGGGNVKYRSLSTYVECFGADAYPITPRYMEPSELVDGGSVSIWLWSDRTDSLRFAFNNADPNRIFIGQDGSGNFYFRIGSSPTVFGNSQSLSAGQWYHATVTWDAGNNAIAYVNGRQVGTLSGWAWDLGDGIRGTALGAYYREVPGVGSTFWDGRIDDVLWHKRPLSPSEVKTLASRRAIAFEQRSRATVISLGPPPPISLQGTIDIDGHSDGDGVQTVSVTSTITVDGHSAGDPKLSGSLSGTISIQGVTAGEGSIPGPAPGFPTTVPPWVGATDWRRPIPGGGGSIREDLDPVTRYDLPNWVHPAWATVWSVQDGDWDDPATWSNTAVPTSTSNLRIDHKVTIEQPGAICETCAVSFAGDFTPSGGRLIFTRARDVDFTFVTLNIQGQFDCGWDNTARGEGSDIVSNRVELIIRDVAPTLGSIGNQDSGKQDSAQLGTGIVIDGTAEVYFHGTNTTPWAKQTTDLPAGSTSMTLDRDLDNWQIGDTLRFPSCFEMTSAQGNAGWDGSDEHQEVTITNISGRTVDFTPALVDDKNGVGHTSSFGSLQFYPNVMHFNRNIIIRSENALTSSPAQTPGHIIITGNAYFEMHNVLLLDMGRTLNEDLNVTTFNSSHEVTAIGTNQIARYPMHFHHMGGRRNLAAAGYPYQYEITNVCVDGGMSGPMLNNGGSPILNGHHNRKWAMAVHDTNWGLVDGCTSWNMAGSSFVFEDGSETENVIQNCGAARAFSLDFTGDSRFSEQAGFGKTATDAKGFWFRHHRNYIRNNWAADCHHVSLPHNAYGLGLIGEGIGSNIYLPQVRGQIANEGVTANPRTLPILECVGNEMYTNDNGGTGWWIGTDGGSTFVAPFTWSDLDDFKVWWNGQTGWFFYMSAYLRFNRWQMVSNGYNIADYYGDTIEVHNSYNVDVGIAAMGAWGHGQSLVENCYIYNPGGGGYFCCRQSSQPGNVSQMGNTKSIVFRNNNIEGGPASEYYLADRALGAGRYAIRFTVPVTVELPTGDRWQLYSQGVGGSNALEHQGRDEVMSSASGVVYDGSYEPGLTNYDHFAKYEIDGTLKPGWPDPTPPGSATYNEWFDPADTTTPPFLTNAATVFLGSGPIQISGNVNINGHTDGDGSLSFVQLSSQIDIDGHTAGDGDLSTVQLSGQVDIDGHTDGDGIQNVALLSFLFVNGVSGGNGQIDPDIQLMGAIVMDGHSDGDAGLLSAIVSTILIDGYTAGDPRQTAYPQATLQIQGYTRGDGAIPFIRPIESPRYFKIPPEVRYHALPKQNRYFSTS